MRLWLAVFASGCASPIESHAVAIVGGAEAVGADATVVLGWSVPDEPFASFCSGSLVAPDVVLTAKHCIPRASECRFGDLEVAFGPDGSDRVVAVADAVCSDSRCGDECPRFWNFQGEDVAALVLAEPVLDVTPYPIPWDGDDLEIGAKVRLVGYGLTEDATGGRRLEVEDRVFSYTDDELITSGGGACPGDSGGSVVDAEGRLVGIIARASDDRCEVPPPDRQSFSTRVTRWLDLVAGVLDGVDPPDAGAVDGGPGDADAGMDDGGTPPPERHARASGCRASPGTPPGGIAGAIVLVSLAFASRALRSRRASPPRTPRDTDDRGPGGCART